MKIIAADRMVIDGDPVLWGIVDGTDDVLELRCHPIDVDRWRWHRATRADIRRLQRELDRRERDRELQAYGE